VTSSTERFLTTHTGSLPRPGDIFRMMWANAEGVPVDRLALQTRVRFAVAEIVRRQRAAGVDIVSDGEFSKPSYATYVKARLAGFGGTTERLAIRDLLDFPAFAAHHAAGGGPQRHSRPACNGPVALVDRSGIDSDVANMQAAVDAAGVPSHRAFLSAASPGVIAFFFANRHYPSDTAYLEAIAEAMRPEYEAIAAVGFIPQLDCPDVAMGRHMQFGDLDTPAFLNMARLRVDALNYATRNIAPERMRMHLCWGNYEGPHHRDVAIADILDLVFQARPAGISFEAANPRHAHEWRVFERVKLPEGKVLIPGVLESKSNFIEHPDLVADRIGHYANLVGRENVIAGSDCGFSTFVDTARIDPDIVWAKLEAMTEGARIATKRFWKSR
jgi:5-methyltetrahydropteroyltriglutamate--homocysteine methyltransferase